jgi:hypothetical protein
MTEGETYQKERAAVVEDIKKSIKRRMESNNANSNYINTALQFADKNVEKYEPEIKRMVGFREDARAARDSGNAEKFDQKTAVYGRYSARIAQSIRNSYNTSVVVDNREKMKAHAKAKAEA